MYIKLILIFAVFYCVSCKTNVKSLTESMGQEIIEIGNPEKDLPPGVEEEPSSEPEDPSISKPVQLAAKKDTKKMNVTNKTMEKKSSAIKEVPSEEEEEMKIEKEFAEIYKDTDYKSETEHYEETKPTTVTEEFEEKQALRLRNNFKFQPDSSKWSEIEKFRTSIDDISCDNQVTQRLMAEIKPEISGGVIIENILSCTVLAIMLLISL